MSDEFSNWKSAIDWPDTYRVEEKPTGEFKSFASSLVQALDHAATSFEISGLAESPIETLFGARLTLFLREHLGDGFAVTLDPSKTIAPVVLQPQFPLLRFRYDFAILIQGRPAVLIECDGKDFHSNPEQVANDGLKDAAAIEHKLVLLRFTGSEIHKDADSCVRRTIVALSAAARGYL